MRNIYKKYNGIGIQDDGSVTSKEFNSFYREFISTLKKALMKKDIKVVRTSKGHYDLSAFVERNDKYAYISYSVPRGNQPLDLDRTDPMSSVLYRLADNDKDYKGKINHFCDVLSLVDNLDNLLK